MLKKLFASMSARTTTAPRWKLQFLVVPQIDFSYTDPAGISRRVVTQMTDAERQRVENACNDFATIDVPALTERMMTPVPTITYTDTLTQLEPIWGGYWPSETEMSAHLNNSYDSFIVIWKSRGTDVLSNEEIDIASAGGLTRPKGFGPTYSTIILNQLPVGRDATHTLHRNAFKHEWGHAIIFYYSATGAALPEVDNHKPQEYVNSKTKQGYVIQDETQLNLIPNSIYNNKSGFTHDYYSGQTAHRSNPSQVLGLSRSAWSKGGPVSKPING